MCTPRGVFPRPRKSPTLGWSVFAGSARLCVSKHQKTERRDSCTALSGCRVAGCSGMKVAPGAEKPARRLGRDPGDGEDATGDGRGPQLVAALQQSNGVTRVPVTRLPGWALCSRGPQVREELQEPRGGGQSGCAPWMLGKQTVGSRSPCRRESDCEHLHLAMNPGCGPALAAGA